jgi:hypothetical protein
MGDGEIMKKLFVLFLLLSAVLAQVIVVPTVPLTEIKRVCERTQGIWNGTTVQCECPRGFEFDEERGCYNVRAENLCERSRGVWVVDNTKVPRVELCDCGFARDWDDDVGCTGGIVDKILAFIRSLIPSYLL